MESELKCTVNGVVHFIEDSDNEPLLYFLRDKVGLRSTRFGCGQGTCGACTVIIDGQPKMSCEIRAKDVIGANIETAELFTGKHDHPLIQAFIEYQAGQCGYCLPGILMASKALLDEKENPTRFEIAKALDANLCRCGAHARILDAVQKACTLMTAKAVK